MSLANRMHALASESTYKLDSQVVGQVGSAFAVSR